MATSTPAPTLKQLRASERRLVDRLLGMEATLGELRNVREQISSAEEKTNGSSPQREKATTGAK